MIFSRLVYPSRNSPMDTPFLYIHFIPPLLGFEPLLKVSSSVSTCSCFLVEVFLCYVVGSVGLYATIAVRVHNISDKRDSAVMYLWLFHVLYHMFGSYTEMGPNNILYTDVLAGFASFFVVALGGTIIGVLWGFLTGLVTRYTHQVRVIEPIFIFVMAYLAYLNAEIFHMSGILAWVSGSCQHICCSVYGMGPGQGVAHIFEFASFECCNLQKAVTCI